MNNAEPVSVHPAAMMVTARLVNMVMGLITIPLLIRYLGGSGFAAWAVLLALAAGFSLLDVGVPTTIVRFTAKPIQEENWRETRSLVASVWTVLACAYLSGLIALLCTARPLALWLRLPDTGTFSAAQAVCAVFAATAAKSFLQTGYYVLYAARRFTAVALISLAQPLLSNLAAILTAWRFGRLDISLIAYWSAQLSVLAATFLWTRRMSVPRFNLDKGNWQRFRRLFIFGVSSQFDQWALFINFQFDKFIVAGLVGLWAVAPYEVANRGVMALRSIPASGMHTFLPAAVLQSSTTENPSSWYLANTRVAIYGVIVFMLAPLAIAPVFLYAWTGEMGYLGRWVFTSLILGAMASVLTLPAVTLLQAAGLSRFQAKTAILAMILNVVLSLALISRWGTNGAALGTGLAMIISSSQLVYVVHRHFAMQIGNTLRMLAAFWPILLLCALWGAATHFLFESWFSTLEPATRYARATRMIPSLFAMASYVAFLIGVLLIEVRRGTLSAQEIAVLRRLPKWLSSIRRHAVERP